MAKYKIIFDKEACIGALACLAVDEKYWEDDNEGKVNLKGSTINPETGNQELIIEEEDLEIQKEAAEVCPVEAIVIEKVED
jgi:ferredoxin